MDDWRLLPSLTLNFGVRWEFFAPYTEKYNHLADVATNPDGGFTSETEQSRRDRTACPTRSSSLAQGIPAARRAGLARAEDQADRCARRVRHELHSRRVRRVSQLPWRTSRPSPTSKPIRKPWATRASSACAQTGYLLHAGQRISRAGHRRAIMHSIRTTDCHM